MAPDALSLSRRTVGRAAERCRAAGRRRHASRRARERLIVKITLYQRAFAGHSGRTHRRCGGRRTRRTTSPPWWQPPGFRVMPEASPTAGRGSCSDRVRTGRHRVGLPRGRVRPDGAQARLARAARHRFPAKTTGPDGYSKPRENSHPSMHDCHPAHMDGAGNVVFWQIALTKSASRRAGTAIQLALLRLRLW